MNDVSKWTNPDLDLSKRASICTTCEENNQHLSHVSPPHLRRYLTTRQISNLHSITCYTFVKILICQTTKILNYTLNVK